MKKIINLLMLVVMIFTLSACGGVIDEPVKTPPVIEPEDPDKGNDGDNDPVFENSVEFSVSLVYNKKIYIPEENEIITVIWTDEFSQYTEKLGTDGFAKKKLDGDYNVTISGLPDDYTYNPNIYVASNEEPSVEIELFKITKIRSTSQKNGTDPYKAFSMSNVGTYRTEIKSKNQKVYYTYSPRKAGWYVVESMVNIYDDTVNPALDAFFGNSIGALYKGDKVNDGGASKDGGYTLNFKWEFKLAEQELGGDFTFGVSATSKTGVYPIYVDFKITYEGEYYMPTITSSVIRAKEIKEETPEFDKSEYTFINADGGRGNYYNLSETNGTGILDGEKFKYNEETGYWHVWNNETNEFGPILCAYINTPTPFMDPEAPMSSLSTMEYNGNKCLTVSEGTENYKQFIEIDYAAVCNSDGVCYVTMELMIFLQKFSISSAYFIDGNGWVEGWGVYAIEPDQWLFACGYYVKK